MLPVIKSFMKKRSTKSTDNRSLSLLPSSVCVRDIDTAKLARWLNWFAMSVNSSYSQRSELWTSSYKTHNMAKEQIPNWTLWVIWIRDVVIGQAPSWVFDSRYCVTIACEYLRDFRLQMTFSLAYQKVAEKLCDLVSVFYRFWDILHLIKYDLKWPVKVIQSHRRCCQLLAWCEFPLVILETLSLTLFSR